MLSSMLGKFFLAAGQFLLAAVTALVPAMIAGFLLAGVLDSQLRLGETVFIFTFAVTATAVFIIAFAAIWKSLRKTIRGPVRS